MFEKRQLYLTQVAHQHPITRVGQRKVEMEVAWGTPESSSCTIAVVKVHRDLVFEANLLRFGTSPRYLLKHHSSEVIVGEL